MFRPIRYLSLPFLLLALGGFAQAQKAPGIANVGTWQPLTNEPPFDGTIFALLLTDGSILCQDDTNNWGPTVNTNHWWKLTPDISGSYVNGTWKQVADMSSDYAPTSYDSAVLKDGRVLAIGGEYNFQTRINTNKGAIYDPIADTWTSVAPPPGWDHIGGTPSTLLPDGRFFIGANPVSANAILDPTTMTWTIATPTDETGYFEEGWTLLGNGTVMEIDVFNQPGVERYLPSLDQWIEDNPTPVTLTGQDLGYEIGPAVLRFDGTVLAFGAASDTAIYTPGATPADLGTWSLGPVLPDSLCLSDAPACLLPNGRILFAASPGLNDMPRPTSFFETDGTSLFPVPGVADSSELNSFFYSMLALPNGQVMLTNSDKDIEIYTPVGGPQDAWRPTITNAPSTVTAGADYSIQGTQFNGLSQTNFYGDDITNATNYPLVRITNTATGHVFYCRTHDHSTMAVATGRLPVSTHFAVPPGIEPGASKIEVVANGIPSLAQDITVTSANTWSGFLSPFPKRHFEAGSDIPLKFNISGPGAGLPATASWAKVDGNSVGPDHTIGTFNYSKANHTYMLNWKTKGLATGTYQIKVTLGDGSVHIVVIDLK